MSDSPGWTADDTAAARAAIPHLQPGLVHLNNAGCSIPSAATLQATLDFLQRCAAATPPPLCCRWHTCRRLLTPNACPCREARCGGYETFDASAEELRRPYTALAALLNCRPEELAVVCSATAAWQQIVYGLAWGWKPGDRLLTSVHEYGSNAISFHQLARRTGVVVEVVPETPDGDIDTAALRAALAAPPRPVLVAITHVPTSSGGWCG